MGYPLLIARTPRAGRFNHVNLLPPELPRNFRPADYLGAAVGQPVGENYIAATRTVRQVESAREGREVLVLAGVRIPADPTVRAELTKWLDATLEAVGQFVTERDWSTHDGANLGLRELGDWRNDCVGRFGLASYPRDCSRPLTRRPRRVDRAWVAGSAAFVVVGLAVGYFAVEASTARPIETAGRPQASASSAEERAWESFLRSLETPLGGDRLLRMARSLHGLEGFDTPSNFAALTETEQKRWLLRCPPFRDWLVRCYGERDVGPPPGFTPYLGPQDPAAILAIERVTGPMESASAVVVGRKRIRALHRLLSRIREIDTVDLKQVASPERFPLFTWVAESHAAAPLPPEPTADIPFLSPREVRDWRELLPHAESLEKAIRKEVPSLVGDTASPFAITACRRLRDLDRYFRKGTENSRFDIYDGAGRGQGYPLSVASKAVDYLRSYPSEAGEPDDPLRE